MKAVFRPYKKNILNFVAYLPLYMAFSFIVCVPIMDFVFHNIYYCLIMFILSIPLPLPLLSLFTVMFSYKYIFSENSIIKMRRKKIVYILLYSDIQFVEVEKIVSMRFLLIQMLDSIFGGAFVQNSDIVKFVVENNGKVMEHKEYISNKYITNICKKHNIVIVYQEHKDIKE